MKSMPPRTLLSPQLVLHFVVAVVAAGPPGLSTPPPTIPFGYGCATATQRALLPTFCNASLTPNDRVAALVAQLTVQEKVNLTWISGCTDKDPTDGGVPRLGIPGYAWGVEILHGAQSQCINGR